MPRRTIAIGDIHGCATALDALLNAIQPVATDVIVVLGDCIDRGYDSRAVVERLMDMARRVQLIPLLGNHEAMFFEAFEDEATRMSWLAYGGRETLHSYGLGPSQLDHFPASQLEFLRGFRLYHETSTHLFVHAGYVPFLPLEETSIDDLIWKKLGENPVRPHFSGKVAICGHTPQPDGEILDLGFLKCIDTACYSGGWLSALEVYPPFRLWQANESGWVRTATPRPAARKR